MPISEGGSQEVETSTGFLTVAESQEVGRLKEKAMEINEAGMNEIEPKPLTLKQKAQEFIAKTFQTRK